MNAKIEMARQEALKILQPTRAELEHGLALHAQAVVVESYGFAPRSAVDGDALARAVEAGASDAELQDLTEDMMMTRCVEEAESRAEFQEAWSASGLTCILENAGEETQAPMQIIKRLARYTYVTDRMPEFLRRAVTPDDIVAAKAEGRHCVYLTTNGVPLSQRWASLEEELGYIRVFAQLGARMMHLTYNRRNMIGDGCAEPSNAGLSDLGCAVVAEMNRQGVIVDVAHSGWRTSLEAAQVSQRPMVASHSGCAALNAHIRCKPDEVIRAIAETGGLIGICGVPAFLGRSLDIQAMLDHIDHVARTVGVDHVAIGTDNAYGSMRAEAERAKVPPRRQPRPSWEYFWPSGDPVHDPQVQYQRGRSLAWTNWPLFTVGLVQRGYSDEEILKIVGGNVLRVARECLV